MRSRGDAAFADAAAQLCIGLLEDAEPRVRLAVGKCLGALARARGLAAWQAVQGAVLGSIERCWVRPLVSGLVLGLVSGLGLGLVFGLGLGL